MGKKIGGIEVLLPGALAFTLAIVIIIAATFANILPTQIITSSSTTSSTSKGVLSILLTDPPNVPEGVTAVDIVYHNLAVHVAKSDEKNGWITVQGEGEITNLLDLVDIGVTLSSVPIDSGKYNLIRFNITEATVTFNEVEYQAAVRTGNLTVPIIGGIEVTESVSSATMIDIQPTVFNIGTDSEPEFVITAVAKAFPVPASEGQEIHRVGHEMKLEGKQWWKDIKESLKSEIKMTSATLSGNALEATVENTGKQDVRLKLLVVSIFKETPNKGIMSNTHLAFFGAQILLINEDGTLQPVSLMQTNKGEKAMETIFGGKGYNLTTGTSKILSYSGQIQMGFGFGKGKSSTSIIAGQKYLISIIGEEALASIVVEAK